MADNPLNYVSTAEDEEVVKLLLLVAGDVETNPGPMVSAPSSNIWEFNMYSQDQGSLPDVDVPTKRKTKNKSCSNCESLRCKILEPRGSREESNLDQFVAEFSAEIQLTDQTSEIGWRKFSRRTIQISRQG